MRGRQSSSPVDPSAWGAMRNDRMEGNGPGPDVALETSGGKGRGAHPTCCAAPGDGAALGLCERESRFPGAGRQVSRDPKSAVRERRNADTVLGIMHERGSLLFGSKSGPPVSAKPWWPGRHCHEAIHGGH